MIGIVDYGMGNLRSVQKALQSLGAEARIVRTPGDIFACRSLILPGVGAFADAIATLHTMELSEILLEYIDNGNPFLGICLGMQLLFETSAEDGLHTGLGVIAGSVERFVATDPECKIPHMGWNSLDFEPGDNPLLAGIKPGDFFYFVHGYYCRPADPSVIATTTQYAGVFCSSIRRGNVYATQFHPEKSQGVGLKMLENFANL